MLPVFWAGYVCRCKIKMEWFNMYGFVVCFTLLLVFHYILGISFDVRTNNYNSTFGAMASSFCGIYCSLSIGRWIKSMLLGKLLIICGKYSLYIMVFHSAIYKIIDNLFNDAITNRWVLKVIQLLLSCVVSVLMGLYIKRLKGWCKGRLLLTRRRGK